MKRRPGRDTAAVEDTVELLGRDLPGQVDRERLRDGDHALAAADDRGVADVVDRVEGEPRVVVSQVVEPSRAHRPAGRDGPGDHAVGDEVDHRLGDHIRVDRERAPVREVAEHLVRHASQTDLQGGAIVDQLAT